MSELATAVSLAAEDVANDRAVGIWWKAGPFAEGNTVRQPFGWPNRIRTSRLSPKLHSFPLFDIVKI